MKAELRDKSGKGTKYIDLPENFSFPMRADVLQKVFEAQKRKQPTGSKYGAGAGYSASGILKHRRHAWKTTYGKGISRVPRKIFSRHGASFNWAGATIASARGGRRAHPPKAEENQFKKINKKELRIAMNSGFAGTIDKNCLEKKYGKSVNHPVVFDSSVLKLKTKEFFSLLKSSFDGVFESLLQKKTVRAGRGKLRGRKYKKNSGLLFVLASDEEMKISGIDTVQVMDLRVRDLAPNGVPGRFACYTEKAIKEIGEKFK